jgi:hypothetical protein
MLVSIMRDQSAMSALSALSRPCATPALFTKTSTCDVLA